jgi:hypothetical protein
MQRPVKLLIAGLVIVGGVVAWMLSRLLPKKQTPEIKSDKDFANLVKTAFQQRRKTFFPHRGGRRGGAPLRSRHPPVLPPRERPGTTLRTW